MRECTADSVDLPLTWHTYVVPGVPHAFQALLGTELVETKSLIDEEVHAQTASAAWAAGRVLPPYQISAP